jgi:hypothetical protein
MMKKLRLKNDFLPRKLKNSDIIFFLQTESDEPSKPTIGRLSRLSEGRQQGQFILRLNEVKNEFYRLVYFRHPMDGHLSSNIGQICLRMIETCRVD